MVFTHFNLFQFADRKPLTFIKNCCHYTAVFTFLSLYGLALESEFNKNNDLCWKDHNQYMN